ncbi:cytochrome P450 CYP736A12-like [Pyrus ussuriensis x Pyrus communis]|uniref:Cytochrome P450 CYP736A12-like n=1 Tax=Pyrus ussuriensis x Pyrus communis TaxID=2448454 RepID=A0A5N5G0A4_9ROSA|nr:cytochrome P450 CYP736A12-like [Pyrus ussuriensis x Pyrus communis]
MAFWIWLTIGVLALVRIVQACISKGKNKNKMLPPGPRGFPIFGSLHLLGKFPTMVLHQLAQKYGDIMYLRLGLQHTLFLKTHDLNFASRPPTEGAKHIIFGQRSLSFAEYGSYWTNMRKICMLELLSNQKINCFKSMRREEAVLLIKSLGINMTCRMVFGKKYKDEEFGGRGFASVMKEGLTKKMKAVNKAFDEFFEKVIDEHLQYKDKERTKDFIDALLAHMGSEGSDYRIERLNIKAMMSVINYHLCTYVAASVDTSSTTVQWALSELLRHPQDMKKVQKELENVVGLKRMVEESDMEKLEYLDMVVKETMRLHPVVPLLLPHAAIEDCTPTYLFLHYHIPKKSRIIINAWAIGRDLSAWEDAEKFVPESFEGNNVDVRGQHFQLVPFGSGRRRCVGMQLGITVVHFVLAQLVHCFDWELPDNMLPNELEMTEEFGLVVSRAKNLLAIPSYRLQN